MVSDDDSRDPRLSSIGSLSDEVLGADEAAAAAAAVTGEEQ